MAGVEPQSTTIYAKDWSPWSPVIDPRRLAKPTIVSGTNFLDDVDGPRSAFGSEFTNYAMFSEDDRVKVTPLRVGTDFWFGTPKGVYRFDPTTGAQIDMINIDLSTEVFWPWSCALCGGLYYFAQYGVGLWQYDPDTGDIQKIATPTDDVNIKFVTASYGRLVMLCRGFPTDFYAWSSLDDGTDFIPSLTTGAGAQTFGLVGNLAYRIDPVADGFIVSGATGIVKATYVALNYVWTHRVLSNEVKIFSPNCGCLIPDTGVVLVDRTGMYITNGAVPTQWEGLMSEYFVDNTLNQININQFGCINLYYSYAMKAVFVSFAPSSHEGSFNSTFVYLILSEKWGSFNKTAWGFFDLILPLTGIETIGYMMFEGYMQDFFNTYQCDTFPLAPFSIGDALWRPMDDRPMEVYDGHYRAFDYFGFQDYLPPYYDSLSVFGLYIPDEDPLLDVTVQDFNYNDIPPHVAGNTYEFYDAINLYPFGPIIPTPKVFETPKMGLNSTLDVGPFRYEAQVQADETSMISSLTIGITPVGAFVIFEDWNLLNGNEDWLDEEGFDDWGAGAGTPDNFDITMLSTMDGFNPGLQGLENLYFTNNLGGALTYAPMGFSGIYHRLKLSATEPGQGFALKYVDIAGMLTGRMTFNG